MHVSRKERSRKGTLDSTPNANGALLALRTSHWCSRMVLRTVSLRQTPGRSRLAGSLLDMTGKRCERALSGAAKVWMLSCTSDGECSLGLIDGNDWDTIDHEAKHRSGADPHSYLCSRRQSRIDASVVKWYEGQTRSNKPYLWNSSGEGALWKYR